MVTIPPLGSGYGVPQQRSSSDIARGPGNAAASAAESAAAADPSRVALDAALKAAAVRQNGLALLFADLETLLAQTNISADVPPDVKAAAQALLALRLPADAVSADNLAKAILRSGVFLEAALAAGKFSEPDLKSALLNLRAALQSSLGTQPGTATRTPPPPPYPGAAPFGQPPENATVTALDGRAIATHVLAETDAALSRQTMLQVASVSDAAPAAQRQDGTQRLVMEIPLLTPQGTAIVALQVERDGERTGDDTGKGPVWRIAFSVHTEPAGPIHARITQIGDRTNVAIVAERIASAEALNNGLPSLQAMLAEAALEPGELNCRLGAQAKAAAAPGRLLDRAT